MRFAAVFLSLALALSAASPTSGSRQAIVVTAENWNSVSATMQRFERSGTQWRAVSNPIRVVLGKSGLAWGSGIAAGEGLPGPVKREGDGRSPAGIFRLGLAFGSEPAAGTRLPYQRLTATWECVDDPQSRQYNRVLDGATAKRDWKSSEKMLIPLYRQGLVVEHNAKGYRHPDGEGMGSCIFIHLTGPEGADSSGTLGCTALTSPDLTALLQWLDPAAKPLLIQLPEDEYQQLRRTWDLP